MKYLMAIITIVACFLVLQTPANAQEKNNDRDKFIVQVDGLGCPFCAYGLEKKFKEFKGIKHVKIDMETGIFNFSYPTEKALTVKKVEKQVELAGYTPVRVEVRRTDGSVEKIEANNTELTAESKIKTQSFFVAGNCGMCKARIEKAANGILGVTTADWNKDMKKLTVSFDTSQTTQDRISKAVAKSGHDTKTSKAEEAT
ncbi:MAG: heavy-metal-associated domain-containing protein, partial [Chitinophagales bacterium]